MGENPALKDKNTLYCSFCGKSQNEVGSLIAGPTVFICNECVELCQDIIEERGDVRINSVRIGPALFRAQMADLKESGFTTADLLNAAGITCTDEMSEKHPVSEVLAAMGEAVKNRLAEHNGEESLKRRIQALEQLGVSLEIDLRQEISAERKVFEARADELRTQKDPDLKRTKESLEKLRSRLFVVQALQNEPASSQTKPETTEPSAPPLES